MCQCSCIPEISSPLLLHCLNHTIDRLWTELGACFGAIAKNGNVRVVVLSGAGKIFTTGLDLGDLGFLFAEMEGSRKAAAMRQHVIDFQDAFTSIERCPQPVIAAVHAACIGGGVDLVTACDVRMCSADAYFCVKEVDLGLAADVGTLQRLGKVIGALKSMQFSSFHRASFLALVLTSDY